MPGLRVVVLSAVVALVGCRETTAPLRYLGNEPLTHYVDQATRIDEPCVDSCPNESVVTEPPRTLRNPEFDRPREMPLHEAIRIALENADVIRSNASFGNAPLLSNGPLARTVHDPAITSAAVVGNTGVEAALAQFDADFTSGITWSRDEQVQNSPFSPAGFGVILPTVATEGAAFNAGLAKRTANGGTLNLTHTMNYQGVPPGIFPFPSSYRGDVTVGYRQPLWAGAGVEYTRIAGPINASTAFTRNVLGQGVVLARINENISLDDFEASVRDLVLDVENLYWDLYLQYRVYNAAVVARNSALGEWRRLKSINEGEGLADQPLSVANEAQALEQYFQARAASERALAGLQTTETRFRRLLGLPVNARDPETGMTEIIRPADDPLTAPVEHQWDDLLATAMAERVEIRRQKWNVKSLELQLTAARKLVRPRLDFVSSYNVNAFGDQLLGYAGDDDAVGSPQGLRYAYESLTQGNQTGWTLGFEFSMPIGFRHATTQVRSVELQLVKARDVLAAQELEISHELATAIQAVEQHYRTAKSNYNRRRAAIDRLDRYTEIDKNGVAGVSNTADFVLRSQTAVAQAESDYYTSLVEYNKAIANLKYRAGQLLEFNNVYLAEGRWDDEAYSLAVRRADARSHAPDAGKLKHTEPGEFATSYGHDMISGHGPFGGIPGGPVPGSARPLPEGLDEERIPPAPGAYDDPAPVDGPDLPGNANPIPDDLPAGDGTKPIPNVDGAATPIAPVGDERIDLRAAPAADPAPPAPKPGHDAGPRFRPTPTRPIALPPATAGGPRLPTERTAATATGPLLRRRSDESATPRALEGPILQTNGRREPQRVQRLLYAPPRETERREPLRPVTVQPADTREQADRDPSSQNGPRLLGENRHEHVRHIEQPRRVRHDDEPAERRRSRIEFTPIWQD